MKFLRKAGISTVQRVFEAGLVDRSFGFETKGAKSDQRKS
jgi:hypothetical protein